MSEPRPQPRNLEKIEPDCVPGLAEVLRTEGIEGVRYATWRMTGSHRDYSPCIRRGRANEQRKRAGWGTWLRRRRSPPRSCTRRGLRVGYVSAG